MMELMPLLDIQKGYVRRKKTRQQSLLNRPEMTRTTLKKRSTDPLSYSVAMNSFHTRSIARRFSAETFKLDRRGIVMGSMLPDEIIINPSDYVPRKFDAAIVFADISGFTHLSEEYNKPGKGGPSRLSIVLNSYIGSIVQEILLHGGDVLKFAGDALLILFKASTIFSLQDAIKSAMDSAVLIQKTSGQRQTDVGVTLRVKIAISAGETYFSLIGNEISSHYVIVGQPIWDVKHAEKLCNPGDIIVTKTALKYINESEYIYDLQKDKFHYKISGFSDAWRSTQRNLSARFEPYSLRPYLNKLQLRRILPALRRFMIPPLLRAIEIDEAMEFLTEMRQVVIVFVNLVFKPNSRLKLIKHLNQSYNTLSSIVSYHEGVVNKVSLFDKDTMYLVVFGLRGFKHDTESQKGLRCAAELYNTFSTCENIITCSIGVTTGTTYCGVVGHDLRREYSVISIAVNKGARLMINYPNRVSCDLETFLGSKMDAKHFVMQMPKQLKGLKSSGPIYKFQEILSPQEQSQPIKSEHPLLGRDEILLTFKYVVGSAQKQFAAISTDLLEYSIDYEVQTCIVIKGDTQQGKSRLLDEIFLEAHAEQIQCVKINLHSTQKRLPFSTSGLFVAKMLGFHENTTSTEKENILLQSLFDFELNNYLWTLNTIFGTCFVKSPDFERLSGTMELEIQHQFLKLLCQKSLSHFWLIIIDDIEFADDDSIVLLESLITLNTFHMFFVLSKGRQRKLSNSSQEVLAHPQIMVIKLTPIDVVHVKALICQFLNVVAIPLELERIVCRKGNGNPGWIQNFLVLLTQAQKLKVEEVEIEYAVSIGLVFLEPRNKPVDFLDFWDLYSTSFSEHVHASTQEHDDKSSNMIRVAIMSSDGQISALEKDLQADSSNLILYDSLSPYEQLICKCASVFGKRFLRVMLMHLLTTSTDYMVAKAIQKLFEIHIFGCAHGDFQSLNIIYQRNENTQTDTMLRCYCKSLPVPDSCRDMPHYSICGYTKFMSETFRDTIYNLLTETQRKEFHMKALNVLEKRSRKCDTCGARYLKDLLTEKEVSFEQETENQSGNISTVIMRSALTFLRLFRREQDSAKLNGTVEYGDYDFRHCECKMILYTIHRQILQHAIGSRLKNKIVESYTEFAFICMQSSNVNQAINLLLPAEKMAKIYVLRDETGFYVYLLARIYTLLGKCYFNLQQLSTASRYYIKACETLRLSFPTSQVLIAVQSQQYLIKIQQHLKSKYEDKKKSIIFLAIVYEMSECLSALYKLFTAHEMWNSAKLAALWSLELSLRYGRKFDSLATTFANIFTISFKMGFSEKIIWLQNKAPNLVAASIKNMNIEKLSAIIEMYIALFLCRTVRAESTLAISLGYTVLRMSNSIQGYSYHWQITPLLVQLLYSRARIIDAIHLLVTFKNTMEIDASKTGLVWYHALAFGLCLDTGIALVSYRHCELFFLENSLAFACIQDLDAQRRFFANMWLWCARTCAWETAEGWLQRLKKCFVLKPQDSCINVQTAVRICEGMILKLIFSIESRNLNGVIQQEIEIAKFLDIIRRSVSLTKSFRARYLRLEIYFNQVKKFKMENFQRLEQAKQVAKVRKDILSEILLDHTLKYWRKPTDENDPDSWRNNCERVMENDFIECLSNDLKIFPFSFRLPRATV